MKFATSLAPSARAKQSTTKIMLLLTGGLGLIWLAAIVYNFVSNGSVYGLKAILMVVVSVLVTLVADIAVLSIRYTAKSGPYGKYLLTSTLTQYSWVTAMIFALILPIGTPYYVIVVGALFATVIGKHIFGGFGQNIFNPAAIGRIFVGLTFGASLVPSIGSTPAVGLEAGVTITTFFNNASSWISTDIGSMSLTNLWLGFYPGSIGETFSLFILLIGIAFIALGVINWRTPVFYLGTVALTAIVIALFTGLNVGEYLLIQLGMGGLMFGAIFMLTDPVSGPTSMFGKAFIGVIAGLLTVLIRVQGGMPEGVVFSIAIANMVSPVIDRLTTSLTNQKQWLSWVWIGSFLVVSLGLNGGLALTKKPAGPVVPPPPTFTMWRELSGSATDTFVDEMSDSHTETTTIHLQYDNNMVLGDIRFENPTTAGFEAGFDGGKAELVKFYQAKTVEQILALTTADLTGTPALIGGVTYTSNRVLAAVQDSLKNVKTYTATASSTVDYDGHEIGTNSIDVTSYVDTKGTPELTDDTLIGLHIEGDNGTDASYISAWKDAYKKFIDEIKDDLISDVLAITTVAGNASFTASVTYSSDRVLTAMKNALNPTYGV